MRPGEEKPTLEWSDLWWVPIARGQGSKKGAELTETKKLPLDRVQRPLIGVTLKPGSKD